MICDKSYFSKFCDLIEDFNFIEMLDNPKRTFTVYAPTNDAFNRMPDDYDLYGLSTVVRHHIKSGRAFEFDELVCDKFYNTIGTENTQIQCTTLNTANGQKLRKFSVGLGNVAEGNKPKIDRTPFEASNGNIFEVNEVILPG